MRYLKDSSSKLDSERKKCSILQDDLIVKEFVDKSSLYGIQDRVSNRTDLNIYIYT
jgi:hypothetical protein